MNKFKKGDKVVVDEDYHEKKHHVIPNCFKVGVPYVVTQVDTAPSGSRFIKVDVDGMFWWEDRFKLYEEPRICSFKPGKKYKTRDGLEAIVYAVYLDTKQLYPIHGAVKEDNGTYLSTCWSIEGSNIGHNRYDIQRNKRTVYVNLWKNNSSEEIFVRTGCTYDTAAAAELGAARVVSAGNNYVVAIAVPIEFEE